MSLLEKKKCTKVTCPVLFHYRWLLLIGFVPCLWLITCTTLSPGRAFKARNHRSLPSVLGHQSLKGHNYIASGCSLPPFFFFRNCILGHLLNLELTRNRISSLLSLYTLAGTLHSTQSSLVPRGPSYIWGCSPEQVLRAWPAPPTPIWTSVGSQQGPQLQHV